MTVLKVKPGADEDANGLVALAEVNKAHIAADPRWKEYNGCFIAGDPENPGKEYVIADTTDARVAARNGRIVIIEEIEEKLAATPSPDEVPPSKKGKG